MQTYSAWNYETTQSVVLGEGPNWAYFFEKVGCRCGTIEFVEPVSCRRIWVKSGTVRGKF